MALNKGRGVPPEFIEQVVLANNIVSVASRYMQLKSRGKNHIGLCPFHHEKTPSFSINENQQFYYCFGCQASGNVITLVKQLESTDYIGAIEYLAKWANLAMPTVAIDPDYLDKKRKKERTLECLESACAFYCEQLYKPGNKQMLEYLHGRNITDELIKTFNIGASPDWDAVINHLRKKGFSDQEIVESGVGAKSEKGKVYDAMAERITFAIFDIYNSCIGFTGRTMGTDKEIAKYRNTAQTIVFDKSNLVYGVDVLKKNKLANFVDKLIVVEGNIDVISLVGAGFINTVAIMGTALTPFHARVFKRFSPNIYLCFDGDVAGRKAALRSLDILSIEGINVRVIKMPTDIDPDIFITQNGSEHFKNLLDNAKPAIDHKLDTLEQSANLKDNQGKSTYIKAAIETIKNLTISEADLYIPKISKVAGVTHESLHRDLAILHSGTRTSHTNSQDIHSSNSPPQKPILNKYVESLNFILACLLHGKIIITEEIIEKLQLKNIHYMQLLDLLHDYKKQSKVCNIGLILEDLEDQEKEQLKHLIDFEFILQDNEIEPEFNRMLVIIENLILTRERDELLKKATSLASIDDITNLTKQIQNIQEKLNKLNKRTG
ncbi:MAG: DNA primase [Firmicutes bacterium]|nr:DNA primase [Bacillota bacterium]